MNKVEIDEYIKFMERMGTPQGEIEAYKNSLDAYNPDRVMARIRKAEATRGMSPEQAAFKKAATESLKNTFDMKEKYKAVLSEGEKRAARNLLSGNIGKATAEMSLAEGLAKSIAPGIAGLVEVIPPMTKYAGENPTASLAETALSPEGSKGIARGVGAMAGMEAGTYLGGLSPIAKGPAIFAGAVAGMAAGAKLGDLLTGIPSIDKAIRALYEKELRKREDKMAEDISSNTRTMQLLEPIQDREYKEEPLMADAVPRMADAAPRNMKLRPGK